MYCMKIKIIARITVGLLAYNLSCAADVVYIKSTEPCLVEAYPAPEAPPLAEKLQCGEKVMVLERRGPIVKIQLAEDNNAVWVIAKETTTAVPAELELQRLLNYQKNIEEELAVLNGKIKALTETSEKLINALIAAEAAKKRE
jgi:hypothetical protein